MTTQNNYYSGNRDLAFYYEDVIDWRRLVPLFGDAEDAAHPEEVAAGWRELLNVVGEYAGREIAGRAREVDRLGTPHHGDITISPPMQENLRGLAELGVTGLVLPRALGGGGFPFVVNMGVVEAVSRADSSTMVELAFYSSPAAMIVRFGSDEQRQRWVPRLARGEIIGWVAMTEPEAGSDVGNVSTRAARQADGTWRITGRKQFISSGNGDVGVVLARAVEGSRGLDGLALFVVPRRVPDGRGGDRENYVVERAEDKVCLNGSPTCALAFDDTTGEIMGSPGDGWRQILSFMNEARLAVGVQATGVAQAALSAADAYAGERRQMGRLIREHPPVARLLLDMRVSVSAMRALWMEAAVAYDLVSGYTERLRAPGLSEPERADLERRRDFAARYLRELTPLVKYHNAEEAVRLTRLGLQLFGGYGVVKDYDVERFVRDSLILPIYEGTSQIQASMAVKDLLKAILRHPGGVLVPGTFSVVLAREPISGELGREYRSALRAFQGALRWLTLDLARELGWDGTRGLLRGSERLNDEDVGYILQCAEPITQMLALLHAARLLCLQAERWPERAVLAQQITRRALDVCTVNARQIERGDRAPLELIQQWHNQPV